MHKEDGGNRGKGTSIAFQLNLPTKGKYVYRVYEQLMVDPDGFFSCYLRSLISVWFYRYCASSGFFSLRLMSAFCTTLLGLDHGPVDSSIILSWSTHIL